ncbi:hypothetical protein [Mergibacter septicus]|nr:hypothetical protein [Mergibacter septicus]
MARQKIMMSVDEHARVNFDFLKRYIVAIEMKKIKLLLQNF